MKIKSSCRKIKGSGIQELPEKLVDLQNKIPELLELDMQEKPVCAYVVEFSRENLSDTEPELRLQHWCEGDISTGRPPDHLLKGTCHGLSPDNGRRN